MLSVALESEPGMSEEDRRWRPEPGSPEPLWKHFSPQTGQGLCGELGDQGPEGSSVPGPTTASGASLASAQGLSLWKHHPDL